MLLADYQAYVDCQKQVSAAWQDQEQWTRISILDVARSGKFSYDRAIRDYCADIWKTWSVRVQMQDKPTSPRSSRFSPMCPSVPASC
jgi:glycogen phosphorylase